MLFNTHKVYTVYDYGSKGQSIIEFTKDQPQSVDITAGRRNELLGVVAGSTVEYTPEPIELIDGNSSFRLSKAVDRPTAFYLHIEPGYILDQISVRPESVDQDLLLESFTPGSRLIYCLFASGQDQVTIRGRKTKDNSVRGKLLKSPRDVRLRRVLLEYCHMDYNKKSLEDKQVLTIGETARWLGMAKKTLQNKISAKQVMQPKKILGVPVYFKIDLLNSAEKM